MLGQYRHVSPIQSRAQRTLMFRAFHQLAHHRLNDTDVPIQRPTERSAQESDPKVRSETDEQQREHSTETTAEQHGFSAHSVRETAPEHAGHSFGEGEGRDQDARIEGGIAAISQVEILDHDP